MSLLLGAVSLALNLVALHTSGQPAAGVLEMLGVVDVPAGSAATRPAEAAARGGRGRHDDTARTTAPAPGVAESDDDTGIGGTRAA